MKLVLFCLESIAVLCISNNILHLKSTSSLYRLITSALIALLWSGFVFFSNETIPNTFVILVITQLLYLEKWYIKLCLVFVYTLMINVISNVNIYLYCIFSGSTSVNNIYYYAYSDLAVLLCIILLSFILKKKVNLNTYFFQDLRVYEYILIISVALIDFFLSSVSSLLFYENLNYLGKYLLIIAIIIMIIMSIVLLVLHFRLRHYHRLLKQANLINKKMLSLEEQHFKDIKKKNDDLRAFRHDYNFHITAIHELASRNDFDNLKQYINSLNNIKEHIHYISTNNPIADAIINYFYESLPENVQFEIEGKLQENSFIDDSDLCIIISNLIKNAVEAVSKEPSNTAVKIFISLYENNDQFNILVENTYTLNITTELSTTKLDKINHGFGLKNVKTVVDKYNGNLNLQHNNNMFIACCYLRNIPFA